MRFLTIRRTKSFVASLMKMKVYIEDYTSNELVINNVPCRKLGELKNGEQVTFQIGDEAAKVFVIADKLSKGYCNEFYQLPYGPGDIFLTGKNKFSIASGNAFRFDNNNSEEVLANRKKSKRKGLIICAIAVVVGFLVGYIATTGLFSDNDSDGYNSGDDVSILDDGNDYNDDNKNSYNDYTKGPEMRTFTAEGMKITLPEEFERIDVEDYTVYYQTDKFAIFGLREEFSLLEGFEDYTLEEYGKLVLKANSLTSHELKTYGGLMFFEYEYDNSDNNQTYRSRSFVFKADDAFWMVQFATLEEDFASYSDDIMDWAKSIEF